MSPTDPTGEMPALTGHRVNHVMKMMSGYLRDRSYEEEIRDLLLRALKQPVLTRGQLVYLHGPGAVADVLRLEDRLRELGIEVIG